MSNVDERIVKMEFDNKAFEQHASETMSTLDKLKNALKFDNVKSSFEKITKAAEKVDVSSVGEGVDAVNAKFSTMQVVGYSAINNITNSLMNFGKRVVGGTFGQIVQGGINRAFNIEQAKFTIEGLGKDFVQLKEDINYAVSGTAYGFDEAAKAASMMAASGIEAGDEMKASLRGISGMAAMTGDSYSNIADIFGNIAGKGKLSLQEVNRFATRGINVAAKLAEQFGLAEDAVRDMISSGEISFQEFAAAMDDAFGTHATEANKTFTGAMSNIKASLSRIGAAFVTPMVETNEKDALLLQSFDKLDRKLINVAQDANKAFEGGVNARSEFAKFARAYDGFGNVSSSMMSDLIKGNEKAYVEGLKKVYDVGNATKEQLHQMYLDDKKNIKNVLSDYSQYTGQTKDEILSSYDSAKQIFVKQLKDLPEYANKTNKELGALYDRYTGFQYNIVTVLQAFKRMLGTIESSITTSSFLSFFLEKLEAFSERTSLLFNAIAATFSGGILTITETVKNEKGELEEVTHEITSEKLWKSFGEAIGMTEADLTNFLDTFKGIGSVFAILKDILSEFFGIIGSGSGVLKPISSIILSITGTIGRLLTAMHDVIKSTGIIQLIGGAISQTLGAIISIVTAVVDAIVGAFTMITDNPVFDNIVHTLIIIGEGFDLLFSRIYDVGSAIIRFFIAPFRKAGVITEGTGHIITSILEFIADILWEFNKGLEATIKWLDEFVEKFIDFAGISRTGKKVANFFSKGFKFDGFLDGIFGIFSGKNAKKASSINPMKMFSGMMTGMKTLFDALSKFDFSKVAKSLEDGLLTVAGLLLIGFEQIGEFVSKIDFSRIAKFLQDGLLTIAGLVIITAEKLKEGFDLLVDVISSIDFIGIANSISKALESFITLLVGILLTLPTIIGKVLSNLANNISKTINADNIGIAIGKALTAGIRLIFKVIPVILTIIVRALQEVLTNLPGILQEFGYALNKTFGDDLGKAFAKIKKMLGKMSFLDILKAINLVALYKFIKEAIRTLKALGLIINPLEEFQKFLGSIRAVFNESSKVLTAAYIRMMIVNLLLLLGGLVVISFIPFDRLINGLFKMAIVAGALLLFLKGLSKATEIDSIAVSKFVASLTGFIGMMILLSGAVAILSQIKNIGNGLFAFGTILLGVVGFMFAISKMKIRPANFKEIAQSMVILSGAIAIMSIGLGILSMLNPAGLLQAVLAVGVIIATFTIASQNVGKNAKSLAAMGPLLLSIAGSLALLSLFDFGTLATSVAAITVVIAALVGASYLIQKANLGPALASLSAAISAFGIAVLAVGGGVYLFVAALHTLSMMGQDGGIQSLQLALSTLASMIPEIIGKLGEGLVLAAQAIGNSAQIIIDAVLNIIERLLLSLLERAYMFATVGVQIVLTLLNGLLSVMDQLVTVGVQICVKFLDGISGSMDSIVNSGILLGVSFINGVANGLDNHSDEIWAAIRHLLGAIANFFIEGIAEILDSVDKFGLGLGDEVRKAKDEVDKIFGDGTVSKNAENELNKTADVVDKKTKKAKNSAKKNLGDIPKTVKSTAQKSKKEAGKFSSIEEEFDKSMKGTIKLADLSKNKDFSKSIEKTGKAYTNTLEKIDSKKSGEKVGKNASSGAGSQSVFNAFEQGGKYTASGYIKGVLAKVKDAYNAGHKLGKASKKGQKDATGESSPAKEFIKGGEFSGEGYVIGMRKMIGKVYKAGYTLGDTSVNALKESFRKLNTNIDDIDTTPTIRPVLDLSNVKMGLNSIDSMFNQNQYALRVAGSLASSGVTNSRFARPMTVNANLTVNNADNGKQLADDFIQELEIYERTYNG